MPGMRQKVTFIKLKIFRSERREEEQKYVEEFEDTKGAIRTYIQYIFSFIVTRRQCY